MTERRIHNFDISNKEARRHEESPQFEQVCRQLWPGLEKIGIERQDGPRQRHGIDVWLSMQNGLRLTMDNKFREAVYSDIALEFITDEDRGIPGWVANRNLMCDRIGYWFVPIWKCIAIPRVHLQAAWAELGDEWIQEFGVIRAYNKFDSRSWVTLSCPVPIERLCNNVIGVWSAQLARVSA
jgi:hypothetical protein